MEKTRRAVGQFFHLEHASGTALNQSCGIYATLDHRLIIVTKEDTKNASCNRENDVLNISVRQHPGKAGAIIL
jgi:hypothetical protein